VIVEDHLALRTGLEGLLRKRGLSVLGATADGQAGLRMIARRRPDVAIVDVGLPGTSGIELARKLREEQPETAVLLYTGSGDARILATALDSGANGVLLKTAPHDQLFTAIATVAGGGTYVDPTVTQHVMASAAQQLPLLSKREREILDLLAGGCSGEDVARQLHLSPETVRTHVRNAMTKLEAKTRAHAIALALRRHEIGV
jgi:DNA-binding NarL/FixJ family response regulator